jgi:divalent metal cation (Fe/Co/Zn/Cd) transporter
MFADSTKIRSALRLEIVTIVWMAIEAAVAFGAGITARSLLLVASGIDSAIELASAVIVFRRFRLEFTVKSESALHVVEEIERKAARVTGYLLF